MTTCACGCGQATMAAPKNTYREGVLVYRKGELRKWVAGHHSRVVFTVPLADRIWQYVDKTETCWLWTGSRNRHGYGRVSVEGRTIDAHRALWEMLNGPVPTGLELDHLCRVRACVNPDHLEPVTHAENMRRANLSHIGCRRGHAPTPENVYVSPQGRRNCRACTAELRAERAA